MSVKGKIKRLNQQLKESKDELETYKLSNSRLREKLNSQINDKTLENIIKFALTNQVGGLRAGMMIDRYLVDKMSDLRLNVEYSHIENAYKIMTTY